MNVLTISFSSRAGGNCDSISKKIANCCGGAIFRFSEHWIHPCRGCRYECFSGAVCPYFGDSEYSLLEAICHSDLVYFVIPNYCDYPCANYFIFNERSQCFFQGRSELLERFLKIRKKFIVISNTNQGHFKEILSQNVKNEPEILFLSAKKFRKVSIRGDLAQSEQAVSEIVRFVEADKANEP